MRTKPKSPAHCWGLEQDMIERHASIKQRSPSSIHHLSSNYLIFRDPGVGLTFVKDCFAAHKLQDHFLFFVTCLTCIIPEPMSRGPTCPCDRNLSGSQKPMAPPFLKHTHHASITVLSRSSMDLKNTLRPSQVASSTCNEWLFGFVRS
jgi:hypothetical protein